MKGLRIATAAFFGLAATLLFISTGFDFSTQSTGLGIMRLISGLINLFCCGLWAWLAARG